MSDDIESKMEFIIQQQATFAVDIADLKEAQTRQTENIDRLTVNVKNLTSSVAELTVSVAKLREDAREDRKRLDLVITEMRQGFDNLIVANEVTRKLAEDVGRLAIATSQRVSALESKQDDRANN
ncbi:MAG TPA: hypothetical protein VKJ45_20585 [Blastocatellia bacterium]|nr:hypothetical protein [Blastocatellia bacterium]